VAPQPANARRIIRSRPEPGQDPKYGTRDNYYPQLPSRSGASLRRSQAATAPRVLTAGLPMSTGSTYRPGRGPTHFQGKVGSASPGPHSRGQPATARTPRPHLDRCRDPASDEPEVQVERPERAEYNPPTQIRARTCSALPLTEPTSLMAPSGVDRPRTGRRGEHVVHVRLGEPHADDLRAAPGQALRPRQAEYLTVGISIHRRLASRARPEGSSTTSRNIINNCGDSPHLPRQPRTAARE
jgi:hypothetical protein